jgi:serine/threonine protein kinase
VPYGQEVDIWSLGVLFFYLLFGEFPFKGTPESI